MSDRTAYLAAEGYVDQLTDELGVVERRHGRLLIATGSPRAAAWAANVWLDPQEIAIASISEAAAQLRALQRNWAFYAPELYRRATLIQERLPKVSAKPLVFGLPPPTAPLGSWTLLDAGTMLAAMHCTSAFPIGEVPLCRRSQRAAEPRLPQTLGSVDPNRPSARARRKVSRSRQQPRRLELGLAAIGGAGR
jgi:hypothetical protein